MKKPPMVKSNLHPRKIPTQKRAEITHKHILDTSAKLLEEVGLDGFNTNLLAERAEVRIGSIYRYFPNKLAILSALVQRWAVLVSETMDVYITSLGDPSKDWREVICSMLDTYVVLSNNQPGFVAIRSAIQAVPELNSIHVDGIRNLSMAITEALIKRGVQYEKEQLLIVAAVFLKAVSSIYDFAVLDVKKTVISRSNAVKEMKIMSTSYLVCYLDELPKPKTT